VQIGAAAEKTGLSVKTIRFYESAGLIPVPPRVGRYRHYSESTVELLLLIRGARAMGLSIRDLKNMIRWVDGQVDWQHMALCMGEQKMRLREQIQQLETQIAGLDLCLSQIDHCPDLARRP